jgi:aspartate/tyrosine/aromatic aminotransferase
LSVRLNWSSPPLHGGRIASIVLNDVELRNSWLEELKEVTTRISSMR